MKSFIKESKRIIKQAMDNNKLIVFVGAGVSANSGYPLWGKVIEIIAEKLGKDNKNLSSDDYLKIPQYYFNSRKEKEYNDLINDIFNISNAKPNSLHYKILELNPYHIITTNYDCLIEQAAAEKGMFYDIVCKDSDLPYTPNNKMIIKMHGDLKNKNFVLKEDDYLNYSQKFKLIETYIKALISSHVILFVGYSINDINIKYIFQWVKEILGKDFQQSYFIYVDDEKNEFNQIEYDYYKNRGINILYYSQACLIEDFKKDVKPTDLNDLIGVRTYAILNYLLQEENLDTVNIDYVYSKIHTLNNLQRVRYEDIFIALNAQISYTVEDFDLILYDDNLDQLFYEIRTIREQNKNKEALEKVDTIESIFIKSGIKRVVKRSSDPNRAYETIFEFKYENISTCVLPDILLNCKYEFLDKWLRHQNIKFVEKNEMNYLERAYALYSLGHYHEAYSLLKYISDSCFKQKKYYLYFISEFNRWHLGRLITRNYFFIDITQEQLEEVKKETELIDLDNLYLKLPANNRAELYFLRDILNFNFVYSNIKEVTKYESEVEKETNTVYLALPSYGGKIFELRSKVRRFWDFLQYNFLMLDNYSEVKQIYYHFIECVLMSHIVKSEDEIEGFFGLKGKKVKMSKLDYFTFYIMFYYISLKEIEYLFEKFEIKTIELNEEVVIVIKDIFVNIVNSILYLDRNKKYYELLDTYIYILSKVDIGKENFIVIINEICRLLTESQITDDNYRNILSFLIGQNNNFKHNIDVTILGKTIEILLLKILTNNTSKIDERMIDKYIRIVSIIIKNTDEQYYLPCDTQIKMLIKNLNEEKDCTYPKKIIIYLYNISNKELKTCISKIIHKILGKTVNFSYKHFELYYEAVINKIIDSSIEYEIKLIKYIDDVILKREEEIKKGIYTCYNYGDPIEHHLGLIANLLLEKLIVDPQQFEKYRGKVNKFDFLYNIDEFDFEKFEIEWLRYFSNSLHQTVSKNKRAKKMIKGKLKLAIIENDCDRRLREIFFQYYD